MAEDEAFARRLQGDTFPLNFRVSGQPRSLSITRNASDNVRPGPDVGMRQSGPDQPVAPNPRLSRDIRLSENMDMLQQLLTILHNQSGQPNVGREQGLTQILRLGSGSSAKPNKPTAAHLASMLPTRKYKKSSFRKQVVSTDELKLVDESLIDDDDGLKCRICLELYEEGDEVKTLPCFHIFHSECIDKWFQFSDECCICKNSVSGSFKNIPQGIGM